MPDKDLDMWAGLIRFYEDLQNDVRLEDQFLERFPATDYQNANKFLLEYGANHLKEQGLNPPAGVKVLELRRADAERVRAPAVVHHRPAPAAYTHQPAHIGAGVGWKPFACPITKHCKVRYIGDADYSKDNYDLREVKKS